MTLRIPLHFAALLLPISVSAQSLPQVIPLWQNGAPGFESRRDEPELAKDYWVRNVNNPSLAVFLPPKGKTNGCAVLVVPGGGFKELVYDPEGRQAAEFLNTLGVTAFVLKYRLPKAEHSPYTMENVSQDVHRAMRVARIRAAEFNVDPKRIGILGFSAGGVMVMMVSYEKGDGDPAAADPVDRANSRPDFEMLVYPGKDIVPRSVPSYSPPAFMVVANDDQYGCDQATLTMLENFRAAGVSVEAHFIAQGKHAFNMGTHTSFVAVRNWPQRMAEWMEDRGLLKPTEARP